MVVRRLGEWMVAGLVLTWWVLFLGATLVTFVLGPRGA